MQKISASSYVETMKPWLAKLPEYLRQPAGHPELAFYGTGESAHWPTQSNLNVFAALAVLSTAPELDAAQREEAGETALRLLRYAMATHITGNVPASDGRQWGCHWISVLGLERMSHGLNAIRDRLTDRDCANLRRLTLCESDWLLDHYPVVAAMINSTGQNKPESNIWNGGFLLRASLDYPDAPRAAEYRAKAAEFFLNGLSHPLDAASEVRYNGKPLREYHVGFNFTANWSLDHHGYLNVGYMVICLSNIAMLHFYCKERGYEAPPELYLHVRELWNRVKHFLFSDGRLLRLGGDTRARYTYCQDYAIPMWLLAADCLGDADAAEFEKGWLGIVRREAAFNGDGGFYSRRLAQLRDVSYYYFTRLESDAVLTLSYGAYYRRKFAMADCSGTFETNPPDAWQDEYHGATFLRDGGAVRSFVWHGGQGPTALCVPAGRSDMAEWQGNLRGEIRSCNTPEPTQGDSCHELFPGGFVNCGVSEWREADPMGEGEAVYSYARHRTACAALPDGRTMLFLEYADMLKEATLCEIKGMSLKIPNDLFNGGKRVYRAPGGVELVLDGNPELADDRTVATDRLSIDGELNVFNLYGGDALTIRRVPARSIIVRKAHGPWMSSLGIDEICNVVRTGLHRPLPGAVLLDGGYAAAVGGELEAPVFRCIPQPGLLRMVEFQNGSGHWIFAANFGETAAAPQLPGGLTLLAGSLGPGCAALWQA
ncbi:MAG: hypothetical protein HPZ91_13855 [Lentisphaeria bacterium]|nr:hypothetical protein [Lentisphaeria bacterium]